MGWHYNDLDVYVSAVSDVLDETSYETENWFRVSQLGLIRSRPTITRSTNSTQKQQIPGTIGELRSTVEQRSNAKIQFEILVADAWPFASLKTSQNTLLQTVLNRALYLEQVLNQAKRVAIKEQGHPTKEYYDVVDVAVEFNDADEKASVLKCTMEVYPFIYDFSTNAKIVIPALGSQTVYNTLPYSECSPLYLLYGIGSELANKSVHVTCSRNNIEISNYTLQIKPSIPSTVTGMVIDTKKMQAYDQLTLQTGNVTPLNRYCIGDYDKLRLPANSTAVIENLTSAPLHFYMRRGMRI